MKEIQTTAIVGMGALGLLYGNQIAAELGTSAVRFIADKDRIKKYREMNFTVNGERRSFPVEDCETAARPTTTIYRR